MEKEHRPTEMGKRCLSCRHRRVIEDSRGEGISLCACAVGRKYLIRYAPLGHAAGIWDINT